LAENGLSVLALPTNGNAAASGPATGAVSAEEFRELAHMVEQLISNATAQTKINNALVSRLFAVERKISLDKTEQSAGKTLAQIAGPVQDRPTCTIEQSTRIAAGENFVAGPGAAAAQIGAAPPIVPAQKESLPMYVGNSLVLCRTVESLLMYVDTRDPFFTAQLLTQSAWEPAETRLVTRFVRPGMTVVDVGARQGYFTLLFATGVGRDGQIYAFEPDPRNREILHANLRLNGFLDRVKVVANAAPEAARQIELESRSRRYGDYTLLSDGARNSALEMVWANSLSLDETVDGPADFMRIDAADNEPAILRGMQKLMARSPRLTVLMKFIPDNLRAAGFVPQEFVRELGTYGYTVHRVTPQSTWFMASDESLLREPVSTVLLTRKAL
jgi:FkbM family methyltransferase